MRLELRCFTIFLLWMRNEEILNLINNVGLSNINDTNSKKSSGKILGLFRF